MPMPSTAPVTVRRTARLRAAGVALLAGAAVGIVPGHASAEVKDASASGFTVENVRTVPVDAASAYKAVGEQVDRWWPKDHTWWGKDGTLSIEPRAGGCFCERAGTREAAHLQVAFVDPGHTLRMIGGLGPLQGMGLHGALEFRFAPAPDGGTTITLVYRVGGYTPDDLRTLAPVVDRVQGVQLGSLAEFLGAKPASK